MTDQEEKVMIAKAKAGDPKANYEMCLWALEQAAVEPDEERWKRLAAKCLVESAQAGYAPAQKKMEELVAEQKSSEADDGQVSLDGWDEEPPPAREEPFAPEDTPTPDWSLNAEPPLSDEDFWTSPLQDDEIYEAPAPGDGGEKPDPLVTAREAVERLRAAFGHDSRTPKEDAPEPPSEPRGGARFSLGKLGAKPQKKPDGPEASSQDQPGRHSKSSGGGFMDKVKALIQIPKGWSDATWKKVELICGIVAVAMVILIVVLIVTGNNKTSEAEVPTATPQTVETAAPTIEPFPTTTVRNEINDANTLDYKPLDEQFLSASEQRKVSAEGGLNLRRGPASTYESIRTLTDGMSVDVYASKTDDDGTTWALVNAGGTWGWASMDYLE